VGVTSFLTLPRIAAASVLVLCAVMPYLAAAVGEPFLIGLFARAMIWSIAALSLNLIMGYGGMISFGHAVYLGVGSYTIGIFAFHDITNAWIQWPAALAISAFVAFVFGAISLRTRGVYFIMITLALSQMLYYLARSAEKYGSDDGLTIARRSDFGISFLNINNRVTLYYVIFFFLLLSLFILWRIVNSRFGMVIRGIKSNETRMEGIGISTYRYKLAAFVIAGTMCGLAGILEANFEKFVSPDTLNWPRSGEMIFMIVLGGMGSLFGPVIGAVVYWLLQDVLSDITEYWQIIFGPLLILIVLFARGGIVGLLNWKRRDV
jgi:branched-chain amino acid transport system permease protein